MKLSLSTPNQFDIIGINDGMIEGDDEVLDVDFVDEVIDIEKPGEIIELVD